MYHIREDKRQQKSAVRLMKGLTECLKTSKMSDISVSELCSNSGVSRSTFYRMFDTPIDLLEYTSNCYIEKAIADYSTEVFKTEDDFVMYTLMYWKNHTDIFEAIISCRRIDIIQKSFEDHSEMLVPMLENNFTEDELAYVRAAAAGLITGLLSLWIARGKKETPAQLFEVYRKCSMFKTHF